MTPVLPAALCVGDVIRSPGGEAVVTLVDAAGPLVRVDYKDSMGRAFVFLPRSRPVLVVGPPRVHDVRTPPADKETPS